MIYPFLTSQNSKRGAAFKNGSAKYWSTRPVLSGAICQGCATNFSDRFVCFNSPASCWNLELCYKPFLLKKHHCNFTQQSQLMCSHPESLTLKKLILKNGSTTALSRYFSLEKSQTSHWLHGLICPVLKVMPGRTLCRISHCIQEHVLRERRFQNQHHTTDISEYWNLSAFQTCCLALFTYHFNKQCKSDWCL